MIKPCRRNWALMTSFLLRAHLRKRLKCSGKMSDFVCLFLLVQQNLGVLFTRHWENPSMPILKDHLEIRIYFCTSLGFFVWKVFDHMAFMAFSQTSKREFWQCCLERFWDVQDLRSAAHLLRWPLRTHKESFPKHLSWKVSYLGYENLEDFNNNMNALMTSSIQNRS